MPHIPSEIHTKLERAESKFIALKNSVEEWCDANELTLVLELRPNRHGINLICEMEGMLIPIESWRLDFGEIIYTLRSALDNLIYFCASRHLDPPAKPRSLYFPIFTDPHQFAKTAKSTISQVEVEISELIEKIQPYHRGKPDVDGSPEFDPLVSLNFFSNLDKHRMPVPFLVPPNEISFNQTCQFYTEEEAKANIPPNVIIHADPLMHGNMVMEYITNCPLKEAAGNFQIKAGVAVEVNNHRRELFEVLSQLIGYTKLVIGEFEKTLTIKSTRTPTV